MDSFFGSVSVFKGALHGPEDPPWLSVLEATGQPVQIG